MRFRPASIQNFTLSSIHFTHTRNSQNKMSSSEEVESEVAQNSSVVSANDNGWSPEQEQLVRAFVKANPKLLSNDKRGQVSRKKLWQTLHSKLTSFTVAEIELKCQDLHGKWRPSDVEDLIDYFRSNPSLWNCKLKDYHNKISRSELLESFSLSINLRKNAAEIQNKFENLKTTFLKYSIARKGSTGDGASSEKPWIHYKALLFLQDCENSVASVNNLEMSAANDDFSGYRSDTPMSPDSGRSAGPSQRVVKSNAEKRKEELDSDVAFKKKIIDTLSTEQSGLEAFGVSIASGLKKFSENNQEFVKLQVQMVLAESLRCEAKGDPIPYFKPV